MDSTIYNCCCSIQVEKQRAELSRDLEDISDRLEEAGGATVAQVRPKKT